MYSAIVLSLESRTELLLRYFDIIKHDLETFAPWNCFAHHMTIRFGSAELPDWAYPDEGSEQVLLATHWGISDMAIAVKVSGYRSENETAHITVAVNTEAGGKPWMSNEITHWIPMPEPIELVGKVTSWEKLSTDMLS